MFDEQILIEESKKHFKEFLQKGRRSLTTLTGDSSLTYTLDEKLQKFVLKPSKGRLYLPLARFLDKELDEDLIMRHIYHEIALYPDGKEQTKRYLNRKKDWQGEMDGMANYILSRIKKEGLEENPTYQPKIISNYARKEILNFLYLLDKYVSFLRVLQMCPIYKDKKNSKEILSYTREAKKTAGSIYEMPRHKAFSNSFLITELYKEQFVIEGTIKEVYN